MLESSRPWRGPTDDSLRRGAERIYRRGRKAHALAVAERDEESLHESRKQTKYLGQALEVLAPAARGGVAKHVKCAESIADALGDDHDLALLCKRLAANARPGSSRQALLDRLGRRRKHLQRKAAKQGRSLYQHKAKPFADSLDLRSGVR